ncbi:MAG: hypothetical protein JSW50_03095 [Candidatus Latescibacterota bacterium]|nr:MAG: hypothetical protein JSW50_03095 [Candidatus Latescibacterota bacterium]
MDGRMLRITVLMLAGMVMLFLNGCEGRRHKDRFQWANFVNDAVKLKASGQTEAVYFDVPRIMPFEWEKFYVFAPRTTVETIEKTIGFGWRAAKKTKISERDDITLLVFVAGFTIHEYIVQPRAEGDFSELKTAHPYTRRQAYFEIVERDHDGQKWYVFIEAERNR